MPNWTKYAIGFAVGAAVGYWLGRRHQPEPVYAEQLIYDAAPMKTAEQRPQNGEQINEQRPSNDKPPIGEYIRTIRERYGDEIPEPNFKDEEVDDSEVGDPRMISEESFGEFSNYDTISVTYYTKSHVLADELDEIIDNPEETVADLHWLERLALETDDNMLYSRNDNLECDYEIWLDRDRTYEEAAADSPFIQK